MHGIRVWRYLQCANICRFKRAQCHSAPFLQLWNLITDSCLTLWILIVSCHSCLQFLISVVSSTHFWVRCQAACLEASEALEDARQREKASSVQNLVDDCDTFVCAGPHGCRGWGAGGVRSESSTATGKVVAAHVFKQPKETKTARKSSRYCTRNVLFVNQWWTI